MRLINQRRVLKMKKLRGRGKVFGGPCVNGTLAEISSIQQTQVGARRGGFKGVRAKNRKPTNLNTREREGGGGNKSRDSIAFYYCSVRAKRKGRPNEEV